jgi:hypothetical protein
VATARPPRIVNMHGLAKEVAMENRNEAYIDWINLLLGIALLISPFLMGFATGTPMTNALVGGVIIIAVAVMALVSFAQWEEWVNLVLGLWVLVSPWVLGFTGIAVAFQTHVVIGLAVAVLAAVELFLVMRHPPTKTI